MLDLCAQVAAHADVTRMDEPGARHPGEVPANAPGVFESVEDLARGLAPRVAAGIARLRSAVQRPVRPAAADLATRVPATVVRRRPRIQQRVVRAVRPAPAGGRARWLRECEHTGRTTQCEQK